MLRTGWSWKHVRSCLNIAAKIDSKKIFSLIVSVLPLALVDSPPATATFGKLGVVKSEENIKQWQEITSRLQSIGVDYCILEASTWEEDSDLYKVSVLFLPNIPTINGAQAQTLQTWMSTGGKTIVTGPTGTLSQPEVKSQLQDLFGAYWGFSLSSPSTLKTQLNRQQYWFGQPRTSATLMGGSLIPTKTESKTTAVWIAERSHPAVIVTDQSTSIGWRWGSDAVAPAELDIAWLQAALSRHGVDVLNITSSAPRPCNPKTSITDRSRPRLPKDQQKSLKQQDYKTQKSVVPVQYIKMGMELEGTIARFESASIAAEANNSNTNLSTGKVIQQLLGSSNQSARKQRSIPSRSNARQALVEAKQGLRKFYQLAEQKEFALAKDQWSQTKNNLWRNYPTNRRIAQPEVRAIWLDRGTIVKARSESDLAKLFDRLAASGINTIFFETVNASYTIYPSKVAPEQNPLTKGWDPLKAAVKLARDRGMELHAWVWIFAAANQRHNTLLNQPTEYLGPVLSANPHWAMRDNEGRIFHHKSKKAFLDPANPQVQRYLSNLLDEISTRYQVDGIHLDYIRYPFQSPTANFSYGFGIASRQLFRRNTGMDPIKIDARSYQWSDWNKFRIAQIDSFVETTSQNLKSKRPDLILSAAVFPFLEGQRLYQIQQNWEKWAQQGWVDMIVPMTYADRTSEFEQMTKPLFRNVSRKGTMLLPGVKLLNVPDMVVIDEMQLLRDSQAGGYALFAAQYFNSNLEKILSRTQGSLGAGKTEPLPYRQPFQASLGRYQALRREWNYVLSQNQISLDRLSMAEMGAQADSLEISLKKLAQKPSLRDLFATQTALRSFKRDFGNWMRDYKKVNPYQVQAWSNRLESLERLLKYGEHNTLSAKR